MDIIEDILKLSLDYDLCHLGTRNTSKQILKSTHFLQEFIRISFQQDKNASILDILRSSFISHQTC